MGLRTTIGWVLHGHANTTRTLDSISADLRALQERVEHLAKVVEVDIADLRERQLTEFEGVRNAVIAATDDLSARVAALQRSEP